MRPSRRKKTFSLLKANASWWRRWHRHTHAHWQTRTRARALSHARTQSEIENDEKSSIGSLRSARNLSVCSCTLDEEDLFRCWIGGSSSSFREIVHNFSFFLRHTILIDILFEVTSLVRQLRLQCVPPTSATIENSNDFLKYKTKKQNKKKTVSSFQVLVAFLLNVIIYIHCSRGSRCVRLVFSLFDCGLFAVPPKRQLCDYYFLSRTNRCNRLLLFNFDFFLFIAFSCSSHPSNVNFDFFLLGERQIVKWKNGLIYALHARTQTNYKINSWISIRADGFWIFRLCLECGPGCFQWN